MMNKDPFPHGVRASIEAGILEPREPRGGARIVARHQPRSGPVSQELAAVYPGVFPGKRAAGK